MVGVRSWVRHDVNESLHKDKSTKMYVVCSCACACVYLALSEVAFNGMLKYYRALIKRKHLGRFDYSFGSKGILSRNWLAKKWLRKPKKTHHFRQQHLHKYPRMNGSPQHECLQKGYNSIRIYRTYKHHL